MNIKWSGKTSSYHHKWNDTPNPSDVKQGIRKVWFLDAQWSTCPTEVENQVKDLWKMYELGNDHYIIKMDMEELQAMNDTPENYCEIERWNGNEYESFPIKVDAILQYAKEQGVNADEQVIIHWWW